MRAPQCAQYGRLGSTARSQRGQTPVSPRSAAAIGLTSEGSAVETAAPASTAAIGALPVVVAPRVRAAAVIGFPQSMQKRDVASFSRPQKAQMARELTVGGSGTCGANIRDVVVREQQWDVGRGT